DGPLDEAKPPATLILVENLGAGDVGRHEVRRELDALEIEVQDVGERLDQQCLRQTGHAGNQAMAAGEQRDQHVLDNVVLADDDLAKLAEDPLASFRYPFGCDRRAIERDVQEISMTAECSVPCCFDMSRPAWRTCATGTGFSG